MKHEKEEVEKESKEMGAEESEGMEHMECPVCGSKVKERKKVRTIEDLQAVAQAVLKGKSEE